MFTNTAVMCKHVIVVKSFYFSMFQLLLYIYISLCMYLFSLRVTIFNRNHCHCHYVKDFTLLTKLLFPKEMYVLIDHKTRPLWQNSVIYVLS